MTTTLLLAGGIEIEGDCMGVNNALPSEPLFTQLEIGKTYRAVGPLGKNGPPPEVKIVGVTDKGYVTEGKRQTATLIAFGCERFWNEVI